MLDFATSRPLERIDGIRHGFFGRRGGSSTGDFASLNASETAGDNPAHVRSNREQITGALGISLENLVTVRQVHSTTVLQVARRPSPWDRPEADALVTDVPGLALGILTADCAPILFADTEARIIGAAHAGWKGALGGIGQAAVDVMVSLGAKRENIVAAIGPTISGGNYEVGPEFASALLKAHPDAANRIWLPEGSDREHFDLPGFIFDRLSETGIALVDDLELCTYAAPKRYFSHRLATHRGATTGRQLSVIGLA